MAAVNKVILIGNVGQDPITRETPNGAKVANFSLATTERFTDQHGNKQEKTEWHSIVAWNKQAETIQQYVKKGSPLYIEGSIQTRKWKDTTTNQDKYKTEILVRSFQFLGGGQSGGQSQPTNQPTQSGYSAPSQDFGSQAPEDDLPF